LGKAAWSNVSDDPWDELWLGNLGRQKKGPGHTGCGDPGQTGKSKGRGQRTDVTQKKI